MIKKIISKILKNTIKKEIKKVETKTFVSQNKNLNYVGVPAPVILSDDPWFGSAPKTETSIEYKEKFALENVETSVKEKKEPKNIHQLMYEIATKNQNTTLDLNPVGGSENFHGGLNGWHSGTGYNQFRND